MAYFVNLLNEKGEFELIDGDFLALYPQEIQDKLIALTDIQYQEFLAKGNGYTTFANGKFVFVPLAPTAYHDWNGSEWVENAEKKSALVEQTRQSLLSQLSSKTDNLKSQVLAGYPQTEIDSFYRQEREARAWLADNTTATPMLTNIAEKRGVSLEILAQKIVQKAEQFAVVIGKILGEKQRFEDRLTAVKNLDEFASLEQEIAQWTLNVSI